jgi:hypothetical protein
MTLPTTTIARCHRAQLKALLALANVPAPAEQARPIPVPESAQLRRCLTELLANDASSGELLIATVSAPTASLTELRLVKDLAKGLVRRAQTSSYRDAATLLYHAALAAAYARHGVNLSAHAMAARRPLYEALAQRLEGDPLAAVFRRAVGRARQDERTAKEPDSS